MAKYFEYKNSHTLNLLSSIILSQRKKIYIYIPINVANIVIKIRNEMEDYLNVYWNPIRVIFTITLSMAKYFEYKNSSILYTASPIFYHPILKEENLYIYIPINIAICY